MNTYKIRGIVMRNVGGLRENEWVGLMREVRMGIRGWFE